MTGDPDPLVHVVDDDPGLREALTRLLSYSGYEVRAHATAGDFLVAVPGNSPGCVLLDLELPGLNGLELLQVMRQRRNAMPVIFMSAYGDVPRTVQALKGGACDFLVKPVEAAQLLAAVESALVADPAQAAREEPPRQGAAPVLSERERRVLADVVAGRLNKQIAYDLQLSERTIKSCRAELMRKLHARSLAELIRCSGALRPQ